MMRKLLLVVPLVMLAAGSTACATKKFVRGEVGQVNTEGRGPVDAARRDAGAHEEERSRRSAKSTRRPTRPASRPMQRKSAANTAGRSRQGGGARAEAVETASKRLIYEVVLSEDQGNFKFGKADLPGRGQGARSTR